jgi:hypothetical protein
MLAPMIELFQLIRSLLTSFFRSRASKEAEIVALRHQLNVLRRQLPKRHTIRRNHSLNANSRWIASPIWSDLISDKDRGVDAGREDVGC